MNRTNALRAVFLLSILSAVFASASPIVPDLVGGPTASGGNFRYDYQLLLAPNERLDATAASGVTCPGKVQCNAAGAFVTLYDIPGFVSASTAAGWSVTTQSVGNTPSSIKGTTIDAPALTNVTFHYTGPTLNAGLTPVIFSGFNIVSTVGSVNTHGGFSSQATLNIGAAQGLTDQGVGSALVPSATIGGSIPSQGNAGGSLVPVLVAGPVAAGSDFAYNYAAHLAGYEDANPAAAGGVACPGMGANIQCDPTGIFFTIYDIPGFVSASTFAANWALTEQLVGSTPSSIAVANDDPSLINVTFRYTGPRLNANGTDVSFNGFQIISSFDAVNIFGTYTGQSIEDDFRQFAEQGVGSVAIPLAPNAAPEPATLALVVSGLAGIGLARQRRPARPC